MDQTRDDVRVDQVEVIVGSKDVGGDDRGEVASVLLVVGAVDKRQERRDDDGKKVSLNDYCRTRCI